VQQQYVCLDVLLNEREGCPGFPDTVYEKEAAESQLP
jgi:hypothetical protein